MKRRTKTVHPIRLYSQELHKIQTNLWWWKADHSFVWLLSLSIMIYWGWCGGRQPQEGEITEHMNFWGWWIYLLYWLWWGFHGFIDRAYQIVCFKYMQLIICWLLFSQAVWKSMCYLHVVFPHQSLNSRRNKLCMIVID